MYISKKKKIKDFLQKFFEKNLHAKKIVFFLILEFFIILISFTLAYFARYEELFFLSDKVEEVFYLYVLISISAFFIFKYYLLPSNEQNFSRLASGEFVVFLVFVSIVFFIYDRSVIGRSFPIILSSLKIFFYLFSRYLINLVILNFESLNNQKKQNVIIYGINRETKLLKDFLKNNSNYKLQFIIDDKKNNIPRKIFDDVNLRTNYLSEIRILRNYKEIKKKILKGNISRIFKTEDFSKDFNKEFKSIINKKKINIEFTKNINESFLTNFFYNNEQLFYERIFEKKFFNVKKNFFYKDTFFKNKKILVTGGNGTIGAAIINHLSRYNCKKIVSLDNSEINCFNALNKKLHSKNIQYILGSINDLAFINNLFSEEKFDFVFHAAAFKHVSIVEKNILPSIYNNVIGTKNVVQVAIKNKVKDFIFVSTDKAAKPKSIMGYTKKIGENIVDLYKPKNSNLYNYKCVRFGNVIGSSGSVLTIFLDNILKNEDIVVRGKNSCRFFMTSAEAAYLVCETAKIKSLNSAKFIFEMGEPRNIYDIAKKLIKIIGADNKIKIKKLLKEEKTSEDLYDKKTEKINKTSNLKIFSVYNIKSFNFKKFQKNLNFLIKITNRKVKNQNLILALKKCIH